MRIQLYIISLIIYLLLPYYVLAKQQNKKNVREAPAYIADSVESDEKGGSCFHCNSFVTDAFTLSFKLKTLLKNKNNFFNISKQPVINMHDSSVIDTAFDFSNRKNEISIYKASHSEMINRFDISDRRFYLKGSISIGMTKENFKTKFSLKSLKGDTIIISDEDNIVRFTFYFKKSALVRITYKAMID